MTRIDGANPGGGGTSSSQSDVLEFLDANTSGASNTATVETDLFTYTITGGTIDTDEQLIHVRTSGTMSSGTATNKRIRFYFAGVQVLDTGSLTDTGDSWTIDVWIIRVSNNSATVSVTFIDPVNITKTSVTTQAPNFSNNIIVKVTGQGDANGDVSGTEWIVHKYNPVAVTASSALFAEALGTERHERVYRSLLLNNASLSVSNDRAYFVYVGKTRATTTPKYVSFHVTTAGIDSNYDTEVGLFSSPDAPNKGNKTLTKLTSWFTGFSAGSDLLNSVGIKRNIVQFSTSVPSQTHLWTGYRSNVNDTSPILAALTRDWGEGYYLIGSTTSFAGNSTFPGSIIGSNSIAGLVPDIRAELD